MTYSLEEAAEILRFAPECLARLLERVPGTLPGAEFENGTWTIPGRALRDLLAPLPLEQMATVEDVAKALRLSVQAVHRWLSVRGPNNECLLPSQKLLGRVLIPAKAVLSLPAKLPDWARTSFFSERAERSPTARRRLSFFSTKEGKE